MADIHTASSTYASGTNDTASTLTDGVTEILAAQQNGPASAIVAIETVLGSGTTLPGSLADLATRLAVALESNGKLKDFSATTKTTFPPATTEGGTGTISYTDGQLVYYKEDTLGNTIRSSGVAVGATAGGDVVTTTGTQTISGDKTFSSLITPTIASFTNATHNHTNNAGGGLLTGNVGFGTDTAWSGSLSASSNGSTASFALTTQTGSKICMMATLTNNAAVTNPAVGDIYIRLKEGSNVVSQKRINPSGVGPGADESIAVVGAFTEDAGGSITFGVDVIRAVGGTASDFDFVDVALVVWAVA